MKKTLLLVVVLGLALMPGLAMAQSPTLTPVGTPQTVGTVVNDIIYYLNLALYLLMAVAVVMFVFYVIKYFVMPNEDRKNAGLYVMYSVIGFFVIFSIWGLVNILNNTFGIGNSTAPSYQQINNLFPRGTSSSAPSPSPSSSGSADAPLPSGGNTDVDDFGD